MRFLDPRKLALLAALLAVPGPVRADIGDTLPELRARYGSAKDMGGQMLFEVKLKEGKIVPARDSANPETHFTITVYFDGVHSGMEVFTHNTSDPAKAELSQDDLNALLNATSNGMTWVPFSAADGKPTWLRRFSKDNSQRILARLEANKGGKADDASVLIIMIYSEK